MIGQRLLMMIGVLFGVTLITFAISHIVPGDPAQMMAGPRAGAQAVAELRAQLGLDRPLYVQYLSFLGDLLQGDLGTSVVTRRPVLPELLSYFPATVELMLVSLAASVVLGVALGVAAAVYADRWPDHLLRLFAITGVSAPRFVTALLLMLFFYGQLNLLPGGGRLDPALTPPPTVTGMLLIDSLLAGDLVAFGDAALHLALPTLTLAVSTAGGFMRLTRTAMLEALGEDYIRTARAMGLRRSTIILRHALRNALLPLVTVVGMAVGGLLFGSVVVETIFAWPGAGSYVLAATFALDFPVIMGFTVVVSVVYVVTNLIVDLLYLLVDPRIRGVA
ncbi:ABC transporter permease [Sphingomonas canadensis]|uniref:ABC transporter permease n=1 Tax=Sphingomonas canadensis TaxID=1219257 RepID=A0ABW3H9L4_9SPHN|nr:ABC transporter permease [Sphingomonas canadensis]MCW3836950.1 ABC transporter permease [Sphingomonas canadensis]